MSDIMLQLIRKHFPSLLATAASATLLSGPLARAESGPNPSQNGLDWNEARHFWSFQTPKKQPIPHTKNSHWPRERLDHFILARLEKEGLSPSPVADKRTLIRRATFDLTGLPPAPEEVEAFLADAEPGAYPRLIDRLLATPAFGERLASLWLNIARYGEDQAHQVGDDTTHFYPNAYHYRAWVVDAFNRDLPYNQFIKLQLAADRIEGTDTSDLAALGFIGLGPKYYNRGRLEVMADEWEDRVDTVTRSFLGLTVACARCHDHKYDPITMEDYYALAGVFASTKMVNKTAEGEVYKRNKDDKEKKNKSVPPEVLHIIEEDEAKDLTVFKRGDVNAPGPVAHRRFLKVLSADEPIPFQGTNSGRAQLAAAIIEPGNPLTARVMVNRLWGLVFGQPLVNTPSNFGKSGDPPTHPELLDDLAARFMEQGWSVKDLVREMTLSASYRQTSQTDPSKKAIDQANRFLWRMNRRRLTVEQWRDAILFWSGTLEPAGGQSMELNDPKNFRRTVYGRVSRLGLNNLLMQFDYPDANVHSAKRPVTTTAMQKLFMLNSPFMLSQSQALAARLTATSDETAETRVNHAYERVYGRPPTGTELQLSLEFLAREENENMPRWEQYAQILLVANQTIYLD